MVGKLIKYELKSNMRILFFADILLLVIAGFGKLLQFFESDTAIYGIMTSFTVLAFVFGCFGAAILTTVMVVIRFYKNLFTAEGYLTLTLPAKPYQHIIAKFTAAVIYTVATFVSIIGAIVIFVPWSVWKEVPSAFSELYNEIYSVSNINIIIIAVEFMVLLFVSLCSQYLLYYACMSLGQLARKNRIIASIGFYFAYNLISQIISSILSVVLSFASFSMDAPILEPTASEISAVIHGTLLISIVWCLVLSVVFFFISNFIISRKLNLE